MPGNYTITTRASGTILTAAIYNADHQNHVDNNTPQGLDDYSANTAQMQTQTDPGAVGTESLATSTAQEIERIRFALARLGGTTYWYQQPGSTADAMKNRIINGDMRIDQRRVGTAVTPALSAYLLDRWIAGVTQASKITFQRDAAAPAGFVNSLKAVVAVAFSSGVADVFALTQYIEGVNIADLGWGTANAKRVTLSFWVFSSITGLYAVALRNATSARSYIATYSIPVANTWTFISINIPGDTTGTWATDATAGIAISFDYGSGSNFNGVASNWQGGNFLRAAGCVNWVANAAAQFYLTGVQLEVGSIASNFAIRPFGAELALCQRYYQKSYLQTFVPGAGGAISGAGTLFGQSDSGNVIRLRGEFPVAMRTTPTVVGYSYVTGATNTARNDSAGGDVGIAGTVGADSGIVVIANFAAPGQQGQVHYTADAEI